MNIFRFLLLGAAALGITVTAIFFQPPLLQLLPLYISLIVMLLQTKANRFGYLVGAGNSVLYAIAYFSLHLYGSAIYAISVSFPLQIITFIRWRKRAYGHSTVLRRLSGKQRLVWSMGGIAVWGILYATLSDCGSAYLILDNTVTVIGIASTIGSLLALIEFPFLQIASSIVSCVLYSMMLQEKPSQITYLIYAVYCLICSIISFVYMNALYKRQQEEQRHETGMG